MNEVVFHTSFKNTILVEYMLQVPVMDEFLQTTLRLTFFASVGTSSRFMWPLYVLHHRFNRQSVISKIVGKTSHGSGHSSWVHLYLFWVQRGLAPVDLGTEAG